MKDQTKNTLKHLAIDVECGMHSGIPDCCIKFFVTVWVWVPKTRKSKTFRDYWNKMEKKYKYGKDTLDNGAKYLGYIPCPSCLHKNNFIQVKDCKPEDHKTFALNSKTKRINKK